MTQTKKQAASACDLLRKLTVTSALAVLAVFQTGCSAGFGGLSSAGPQSGSSNGVALSGIAKGGQPPVSGATIQLYAVGTSGYGSAATPLLSGTPVTTNADGGFTLPAGSYTCPANSYVYMTASSGNPGLSANNTALALMVALGSCSNLSSSTFVSINELTTVAAVWSMAQFGSSTGAALSTSAYTGVPTDTFGTSATNIQGVANAMAVANVLVNSATGTSPGTNTTGNQLNVEYWHINTLADILAACVNSAGAASASCGTLFSNTGNSTDTIQSALYMAKNPSSNVSNITALESAYAPFVPVDTTTNDFTIGLSFGTGTTASRWIAIDQFGNAWVATGSTNVFELDPSGNQIATPTSYTLPATSGIGTTATNWKDSYEVAVDTANNAWFADQGSAVVEVTGSTSAGGANGATATGTASTYTNAGVTSTATVDGIGVDGNNNVWYAGSSSAMFGLLNGAYSTVVQGSATTSSPFGLAIDLSNNPASPNYTLSGGASFVYALNSGGCSGKSIAGSTGTEGSLDMIYSVATTSGTTTNPAGSATPVNYVADVGCATTSKVNLNSQNYNLTSTPYGIAFDNSNNLWIVNQNYVSADTSSAKYSLTKATINYSSGFTAANINNALSFVNYSGGGLAAPFYIAMDGASAAWVANSTGATAATATNSAIPQGTVSAFTNTGTALSPTTGFFGGVYNSVKGTVTTTYKRAITSARGVAVDPSGNVWVANTATFVMPGATTASGSVTMIVGAATPTVTPLAKGIAAYTLASKP